MAISRQCNDFEPDEIDVLHHDFVRKYCKFRISSKFLTWFHRISSDFIWFHLISSTFFGFLKYPLQIDETLMKFLFDNSIYKGNFMDLSWNTKITGLMKYKSWNTSWNTNQKNTMSQKCSFMCTNPTAFTLKQGRDGKRSINCISVAPQRCNHLKLLYITCIFREKLGVTRQFHQVLLVFHDINRISCENPYTFCISCAISWDFMHDWWCTCHEIGSCPKVWFAPLWFCGCFEPL